MQRRPLFYISLFLFSGTLLLCCSRNQSEVISLEEVVHPPDNPLTDEKVELGRKLFFDTRLSKDSSISCASCHQPQWAFTDHRKVSVGVNDSLGNRNAPTLLNVAYQKTLMFDAQVPDLEQQAIVPIQDQREMNITVGELVDRLKQIPEYQEAAKRIYNRDFDAWVLTRSLSAFERTLLSGNAPFDRYINGDQNAITEEAKAGWKLYSEKLYCTQCHPAPYFTAFVAKNNGLYVDYGEDKGRFRINFDSTEIGKFKTPTLRNVELSYPYMHDGSMQTLDEVLEHYSKGGKGHFNQDPVIKSFSLTNKERDELKAFLRSLTDTTYLENFR